MASITRDYTERGTSALTPEEQLLELNTPKTKILISLFTDDLDKAKKLKLNMNRIIRFKFHDWLQEKEFLGGELDGVSPNTNY